MLVLGRSEGAILESGVEQALGVLGKEGHGELNAVQVPSGNGQVPGHGGTGGKQHRVVLLGQGAAVDAAVLAVGNRRIGAELDPFLAHEGQPPLHHFRLVELHVGNAVHQQATDPVGSFIDRHLVSGAIQLLGGSKAGRAGTDNGDALAGARGGRLRPHPAFREAPVDDRHFDVLDGDRRIGDAEHAGAFAGRRADPAGELGEVVGLVQPIQRLAPMASIDEIVPLGNQVVDRAAVVGLAKRDAAVHAAGALLGQVAHVMAGVDFVEVKQPGGGVPIGRGMALEFHESGWFAHFPFD